MVLPPKSTKKLADKNRLYNQLGKRNHHNLIYLKRNLSFILKSKGNILESSKKFSDKNTKFDSAISKKNEGSIDLPSFISSKGVISSFRAEGRRKQAEDLISVMSKLCGRPSHLCIKMDAIDVVQQPGRFGNTTSFRNCECQIILYELEKNKAGSVLSSKVLVKTILKIARNGIDPVEFSFIPLVDSSIFSTSEREIDRSGRENFGGRKKDNGIHYFYKLYIIVSKSANPKGILPNNYNSSGYPQSAYLPSGNDSSTSFESENFVFLFAEIDILNTRNYEIIPNGNYEIALNTIGTGILPTKSRLNHVEAEHLISFNLSVTRDNNLTTLELRQRYISWTNNNLVYYHFGWLVGGDSSYEMQVVPGFSCLWCKRDYESSENLLVHLNTHHSYYDFSETTGNSQRGTCQILINLRSGEGSDDADFIEVKDSLIPKSFIFYRPEREAKVLGKRERRSSISSVTLLPSSKGALSRKRKKCVEEAGTSSSSLEAASGALFPNLTIKELYEKYHSKREYYHSRSFQVILEEDFEYDSDGDTQIDWMAMRSGLYIDEFSDVETHEKLLMKMWNRFQMQFRPLGYIHLCDMCIAFSRKHARQLKRVRSTFASHLMFLTKTRLITNRCLLECLKIVDQFEIIPNESRPPGSIPCASVLPSTSTVLDALDKIENDEIDTSLDFRNKKHKKKSVSSSSSPSAKESNGNGNGNGNGNVSGNGSVVNSTNNQMADDLFFEFVEI